MEKREEERLERVKVEKAERRKEEEDRKKRRAAGIFTPPKTPPPSPRIREVIDGVVTEDAPPYEDSDMDFEVEKGKEKGVSEEPRWGGPRGEGEEERKMRIGEETEEPMDVPEEMKVFDTNHSK